MTVEKIRLRETLEICSGKCDDHRGPCVAYEAHLGPHLCQKCFRDSEQKYHEDQQVLISKHQREISNLRIRYAER